ncbi:hypothetical protein BK651_09380 [Pseudomonas rhodesiae]|nr:hypothetical protein BK651_09380 [Pseudomonas rhodesiae]
MAGEIRGKQVSLTALKGDITNETTAIQVRDGAGMRTLTDGSGGTIVARENLAMDAGRDLTNRGALVAGNDANLTAGRDLNLIAASDTSVKHEIRDGGEKSSITTDVKNLAASVTAGGSINMQAGQDVNIIGSTATAGKDLNIAAGRDLNIASVSDMHNVDGKEKHGKKRIKTADEQTTQVASVLTAGGDFVSQAGRDTTIVASRISAGNEAYLYSGDKLSLLAAQNSTYSLYDMKEKGGWGAKKTKRDEVTRVTNVGTEIKTGGDLVLKSGGDQTYQLAKLQSGRDITLDSGGAITFEAVKDLHQESHEKSKNSLVWTSAKGKGNTDETLRQSQLIAQGQVVIKAVDGLKIDVTHVDQQTVSQAIDAMVKADPQLAWLKEAEKRGDVDWRRVQEVHDSFKYDHSSLGGGAALVIAIIVTYFTWGAGAGLVGAASTTTTGLVANSVVTAVAVKGATSTINNRGNISDIAKDVTSEDSIKGYAIAGLSGAIAKFAGVTGSLTTSDLGRQLAVNSALRTVTNGGSFTKNVGQAAIDLTASVLSGVIYEHVGTELSGTGLSTKVAVHAIVGGLIAEAAGGDFTAGAIAAGANKALIQTFGAEMFPGEAHDRVLAMTSQLIGMTAAAELGGDAKDQEVAGWVAQQGTVYNYLEHSDVKSFASDMKSCGKDGRCQENKWSNERYNEESIYNTENALSITSSMLAKDKLPGVIVALDELMSIECQTAVCEGYKTELISRSVLVAGHLAKQIADWGPSMDRLALLSGGATGGGKVEPRSRLPGEVDPAGLVQLEKAIKYLKDTKGSSSGLVFGETKVVGTGKPAANDASFSVPKGYTQGADGVVTGPGGGIYKATGTLDSSGNQIYLGGNGNYYTLTVESSTRIVSPNPSLEIGVTGRIGEEALKSLGGQPQVTFQTTQGARVVDQLAPGSIAHESKVGYTSLDANTALQVAKDAVVETRLGQWGNMELLQKSRYRPC